MKFCKAMHEKWRGNVNEVKEGPRRNSENCENHHKNAKITNTIRNFVGQLTKSDEEM